ncbi:MAG: Response regulator, partial [Bacteroidetes bacterium]|nr:Response regulator [Bacteroidota bacterium]
MSTAAPPQLDRRTVWVVEDDERFGTQLARLINMSDGFLCEQVYRACEPALEALHQEIPPDILLMDIGLPGMNGIEGVR